MPRRRKVGNPTRLLSLAARLAGSRKRRQSDSMSKCITCDKPAERDARLELLKPLPPIEPNVWQSRNPVERRVAVQLCSECYAYFNGLPWADVPCLTSLDNPRISSTERLAK
jgi:hypothetical protein